MKKSELVQMIREEIQQLYEENWNASQEAKRKGLVSAGFGRWKDKSGIITHRTQDGKLVPVKKPAKHIDRMGQSYTWDAKNNPKGVSYDIMGNPKTKKAAKTMANAPKYRPNI